MPNENKNPDEGQVQPSPEATDDALTLEKYSALSDEEKLNFYNNAIEMRKSATQKFMETAEDRKRLESEREYLLTDRQRKDAELQRLYDQLDQVSKLNQQAGQQTQPSPRPYEELDPAQAYQQLYSEQKTTQEQLDELKKKYEDELNEVRGEVLKTQRSIKYEKFLEKEIFPKYKYVTSEKLDDWFTAHPTVPADPKTVHLAASEIFKEEDSRFEAEVQARLKAKAEAANQAAIAESGAPLASLESEQAFIDMTPAQQAEQLEKDIKKLQGLQGQ